LQLLPIQLIDMEFRNSHSQERARTFASWKKIWILGYKQPQISQITRMN